MASAPETFHFEMSITWDLASGSFMRKFDPRKRNVSVGLRSYLLLSPSLSVINDAYLLQLAVKLRC